MNEKFVELLKKLLVRTEAGQLRWRETADDDMFRLTFQSGMVRIGPDHLYDEFHERPMKCYQAFLMTPDGRIVEEVRALEEEALYDTLESLYFAARRQARESEGVLERLMAEIETSRGDEDENEY